MRHVRWFVLLVLVLSTPALAEENTCAEDPIRVMLDVPDGDVTFTLAEDKGAPTVNVTVKQWIGKGYYGIATTSLKLKSETKVSATDRGVELVDGSTRTVVLRGVNGLQSLLPHLDLSAALDLVQKGNDIGFILNVRWSSKLEQLKPTATTSYDDLGLSARYEFSARARNDRRARVQPTSSEPGFQWYLSPLLSAKIDRNATLTAVRPCVTELVITRSQNPPPAQPGPRASSK